MASPVASPKPKREEKTEKVLESWAQLLIQFINANLETTLKEEAVPVKIEILEIEFPQKSSKEIEQSKVSVIPWFEGNQLRATVDVKLPTFSLKIAASKGPLSAKARVWNVEASGTMVLGFYSTGNANRKD
jgi:hypothetical protein